MLAFYGPKKYTESIILRNCGVVSAENWNTKILVHHEGLIALETSASPASPFPHVVQCTLSTHWIKPKFLQVNATSYMFYSQVHTTFAQ